MSFPLPSFLPSGPLLSLGRLTRLLSLSSLASYSFLNLMNDEGESKDDVKVPEGQLGKDIAELFDAGKELSFVHLPSPLLNPLGSTSNLISC